MLNTPTWQIPYPESGEHTRTWEFWQAIAQRVDACLTTLKNQTKAALPIIQLGSVNMSPNAISVVSTTVTYPTAFAAIPTVLTGLATSPSGSSSWTTKGVNATTSNFTLFAQSATNTNGTFTVAVAWQATLLGTPMPAALLRSAPPDGWHSVSATCHTPDCPSDGQTIDDIVVPDVPEEWGWTGITCGGCGQPIATVI